MIRIRALPQKPKGNFLNGAFIILLVSLIAYILLQSPLFNVREIQVVGNDKLAKQDLIKVSGITLGSNIFKLNLEKSEERIYLLPKIDQVNISRQFPCTVLIVIKERQAVALLPYEKIFIEVDKKGVYLQKGNLSQNYLPIITGCPITSLNPGEKVKSGTALVGIEVISQLPISLVNQLSEVHIEKNNEAIIYTITGIQGRLGLIENIKTKGQVFLKVLGQVSGDTKIEYVDLTSFKTPVVKYRQ